MELLSIQRNKKLVMKDIVDIHCYVLTGRIRITHPSIPAFTYNIFLQVDYFVNSVNQNDESVIGFHFYDEDPEMHYKWPIIETPLSVVGRKYYLNQEAKEINTFKDMTYLVYQEDETYHLFIKGDEKKVLKFAKEHTESINKVLRELYKQPMNK